MARNYSATQEPHQNSLTSEHTRGVNPELCGNSAQSSADKALAGMVRLHPWQQLKLQQIMTQQINMASE